MTGTQMSEAAKEARREYYREYRRKNRDRLRQNSARYWARIYNEQYSSNTTGETDAETVNTTENERNTRTMSENIITFQKKKRGSFKTPKADVFLVLESEAKSPRYKIRVDAKTEAVLGSVSNFFVIKFDQDRGLLYFIQADENTGYKMYAKRASRESAYIRFAADENLILKPYCSRCYSLRFDAKQKAYCIVLNDGVLFGRNEMQRPALFKDAEKNE